MLPYDNKVEPIHFYRNCVTAGCGVRTTRPSLCVRDADTTAADWGDFDVRANAGFYDSPHNCATGWGHADCRAAERNAACDVHRAGDWARIYAAADDDAARHRHANRRRTPYGRAAPDTRRATANGAARAGHVADRDAA